MSFLKLPTIIDDVNMHTLLGMHYVTFAESWMNEGSADPKSIKIFHLGSDKPVHTQMSLQDLADKEGFILLNVWKYGQSRNLKRIVVNIYNIKQLRPYTEKGKGRIDHFVLFFSEGKEGGGPVEFHLTCEEAARLQLEMVQV